jgi:hypothetical protein
MCFLVLAGCANHPTTPPPIPRYADSTEHYRSSERFEHVAIEVVAGQGEAQAWVARLPEVVADELAVYLDGKGIRTSTVSNQGDANGAARLVVAISGQEVYKLAVRLMGPDGAVVDETTLNHHSGHSDIFAIAQQLATVIADDMLLMWHPAVAAVGGDWHMPKPAPFTLLASPIGTQSEEGISRVSWEPFPSERLLKGAEFSAEDIADVSYELRFSQVERPKNPMHRWVPQGIYRVPGLTETEHTLPFLLPSCESGSWSVRAHFRLLGHPRVTEWAGSYSTKFNPISVKWPVIPPYLYRRGDNPIDWNLMYRLGPLEHQTGGGTLIKIQPPPPLKCRHLDRGMFSLEEERAKHDFQERIELLAEGEAIGAIATVEDICTGKACEARAGAEEASQKLAGCLEDEFRRRSFDVPVHDLSKVLSELPTPPDLGLASINSTTLMKSLRLPENKEYLDALGLTYVVSTDMTLHADGGSWNVAMNTPDIDEIIMDEDFKSLAPIGMVGKQTLYVSSMDSSIIDVVDGEVIGTIASGAKGSKGVIVPVIAFVPVAVFPWGSRARVETKACDSMARRLSFVLRGGVSTDWPDKHFQDEYSPIWVQGEK